MKYTLEPINAKTYSGDLVFLYGDEAASRDLPLGKKEIELLSARREEKKDPFHRIQRY